MPSASRGILSMWLVLCAGTAGGCAAPRLRIGSPWVAASRSDGDVSLLTVEFEMGPRVKNVTLLTDSALSKSEENRLIGLNHGRGVLLPFGALHSGRDVVVFVHGRGGTVNDFGSLIQRFEAAQNQQVCVFLYDDTGRYLNRTGNDLARSLQKLQSTFFLGQRLRLRIVAHSMGGIVARAGLNALANPHWFGLDFFPSVDALPSRPDSVFESVELIAIDTPWGGFGSAPEALREMVPLENSLVDMTATSAVLRQINQVTLPRHFSMRLMEADQQAAGLKQDRVMTLGDLDDEDTRLVERLLVGSGAARHARPDLLNQIEALRSTDGFEHLLKRLRSVTGANEMAPADFRALVSSVVPRYAGSHTSVLENPRLVDAIVSQAPSRTTDAWPPEK